MSVRIELIIDEIVLHGFDPRHRHAIGDAIERQLSALLGDHASALGDLTSRDMPHHDAGDVTTTVGARPAATGAAIAQNLMSTIAGGRP